MQVLIFRHQTGHLLYPVPCLRVPSILAVRCCVSYKNVRAPRAPSKHINNSKWEVEAGHYKFGTGPMSCLSNTKPEPDGCCARCQPSTPYNLGLRKAACFCCHLHITRFYEGKCCAFSDADNRSRFSIRAGVHPVHRTMSSGTVHWFTSRSHWKGFRVDQKRLGISVGRRVADPEHTPGKRDKFCRLPWLTAICYEQVRSQLPSNRQQLEPGNMCRCMKAWSAVLGTSSIHPPTHLA